jgi:hypothetical protein
MERHGDDTILSLTRRRPCHVYIRRIVAGVSPRGAGFDPKLVHVGFVVDKVAVEHSSATHISVFSFQDHSTGASCSFITEAAEFHTLAASLNNTFKKN